MDIKNILIEKFGENSEEMKYLAAWNFEDFETIDELEKFIEGVYEEGRKVNAKMNPKEFWNYCNLNEHILYVLRNLNK